MTAALACSNSVIRAAMPVYNRRCAETHSTRTPSLAARTRTARGPFKTQRRICMASLCRVSIRRRSTLTLFLAAKSAISSITPAFFNMTQRPFGLPCAACVFRGCVDSVFPEEMFAQLPGTPVGRGGPTSSPKIEYFGVALREAYDKVECKRLESPKY